MGPFPPSLHNALRERVGEGLIGGEGRGEKEEWRGRRGGSFCDK